MSTLKIMAIVYEAAREREFKDVLDKLTFGAHCFSFIRVDPQQESSYNFSGGGEMAEMLEMKLESAQEYFIINPKGSITPYLRAILSYAEENDKPVHYMYKYCYKDCAFRQKRECSKASEVYCIPHAHKLLPACEAYARIYDSLLVGGTSRAARDTEPENRKRAKSV